MVSNLKFASAFDAAEAIRRGDISSLELTQYIIQRIEQYNSDINAVVVLLKEDALKQAKIADDALAKGIQHGPLHGVPCTVKDAFEIVNVRTTAGSPMLSDHIPTQDAIAVARLRSAGAIILGHTNVPEWSDDWQSFNEIYGTTNNPWDLSRTPGGSTGGGAAALAAGFSFLSIGSDIGGSIRIPAHFCGVYGHKTSLNIIPRQGHIPPPPWRLTSPPQGDLAVIGPLARSAKDLKIALEILGGPDHEEAKAYKWFLPPARGEQLSDYHIGYILDDPFCPVSPDIKKVTHRAIKALRESGAHLKEGWPPGINPVEQYRAYLFLLFSIYSFLVQDDQYEDLKNRAKQQDGTEEAIWALANVGSFKHYQEAKNAQMQARIVWQKYFQTKDAFILPTSFIPAFPHDHAPWNDRRLAAHDGPRIYGDLRFWISFATFAGLPATTAPIGFTSEGLPVGIQIIGPSLEDATPIDIASKLEEIHGGFSPPKGY
jgi:amidase